MLVLTRRTDEKIKIGDDIEISVIEIKGDRVRLGIIAPTTIAVHRTEIYDAIQRERERTGQILNSTPTTLSSGPQKISGLPVTFKPANAG
jgi:carbon storage regulator